MAAALPQSASDGALQPLAPQQPLGQMVSSQVQALLAQR